VNVLNAVALCVNDAGGLSPLARASLRILDGRGAVAFASAVCAPAVLAWPSVLALLVLCM